MSEKAKKTIKKVVDIILWIFLAFAVVVTIFAFIFNNSGAAFPRIGDTCLFYALTDSMEGTYTDSEGVEHKGFSQGAMIISNVIEGETEDETIAMQKNLKVGDVITFLAVDINGDGQNDFNTHRIIEIINDDGEIFYRTKGDNAPEADQKLVNYTNVKAIWTGKSVPVIGSIVNFLRTSTGFLVCVVVPMACVFIYQLVFFIITIKQVKKEDASRGKISKDEEELIKQKAIEEYLAKQNRENNSK